MTLQHSSASCPLEGRKLLAHELTHVVQQRNASALQRLVVGQVGDAFEREADIAAESVIRGQHARVEGVITAPLVQRQKCDHDDDAPPNCPMGWAANEQLRQNTLRRMLQGKVRGAFVAKLYTFFNPEKGGDRGYIDAAQVIVASSGPTGPVDVLIRIAELKTSNLGSPNSGCARAAVEVGGYVRQYRENQNEILAASRGRGTSRAYNGLTGEPPQLPS